MAKGTFSSHEEEAAKRTGDLINTFPDVLRTYQVTLYESLGIPKCVCRRQLNRFDSLGDKGTLQKCVDCPTLSGLTKFIGVDKRKKTSS